MAGKIAECGIGNAWEVSEGPLVDPRNDDEPIDGAAASWTLKALVTDGHKVELTLGTGSLSSLGDGYYSGVVPGSVTANCVYGGLYTIFIAFAANPFDDPRRLKVRTVYRGSN